jgi:hypothetical protein
MSVSDWAQVVGIIVGISGLIGGVVGWMLRQLWGALNALVKDVNDLQKSLPGTYIRVDEMRHLEDRIMTELRGVAHTLERHIENSTQLWVNSQRDPFPHEQKR